VARGEAVVTPEQRARYEAFPRPETPGPWKWSLLTEYAGTLTTKTLRSMTATYPRYPGVPVGVLRMTARHAPGANAPYIRDDDSALIAAAPEMREAIDVLLAEVARLAGRAGR